MKAARLGPLPLDLCFPCSGVWFDHNELQQLVQAGPTAIRKLGERLNAARGQASPPPAGKCPVCWVQLTDYEFPSMPGIRLDTCTLCQGFWASLATLGQILVRVDARLAAAGATATRDLPPPGPLHPAPPIIPREASPAPAPAAVVAPTIRPQAPAPPAAPLPVPQLAPVGAAATAGITAGTPPASLYGTPPPQHAPAPQAKPVARPGAAEIKCPKCAEANGASSAVCWACGEFLRPAGAGQCSACASPLRRETCDHLEVGHCDGCGGVWVEDGRLDALRALNTYKVEQLVDRIDAKPVTRHPLSGMAMSCPQCHTGLMPELLGMLATEPIMTCPKCYGSFLERGRLAELTVGRRR